MNIPTLKNLPNFTFTRRRDDLFASTEFVSGIFAGVILGLAAGILLAPRSGKDTRKQIAGAVNDQAEGLSNQWDKTKSQAKETLDKLKTNVGVAADKAQDKFDRYSNKAEDKADELSKDTKSLIDKAKEALKIN